VINGTVGERTADFAVFLFRQLFWLGETVAKENQEKSGLILLDA
jgi:hypothetical protein